MSGGTTDDAGQELLIDQRAAMEPADERRDDVLPGDHRDRPRPAAMEPADERRDDMLRYRFPASNCPPQWSPPMSGGTTFEAGPVC